MSTLDLEYPSIGRADTGMGNEMKIKRPWLTIWTKGRDNVITCDKCKLAESFPSSCDSSEFVKIFEKFEEQHRHEEKHEVKSWN